MVANNFPGDMREEMSSYILIQVEDNQSKSWASHNYERNLIVWLHSDQ